jgi:hypothetical protein
MEETHAAGAEVNVETAVAKLHEQWQAAGPVGHPFERYYRRAADGMVKLMAAAVAAESGQYAREEWQVPVAGRLVAVTPDRVLLSPGNVVQVQRIRTGRETKSELTKPIYPLLMRGAKLRHPGKTVHLEIVYLGTGKHVLLEAGSDDRAVSPYADAIAAIERGAFAPAPDMRTCPNCQCYFICRA